MAKIKQPTKLVEVWLDETSEPIILLARNTYTKGPLFCVYTSDGSVHKFPLMRLFRVIEEYRTE